MKRGFWVLTGLVAMVSLGCASQPEPRPSASEQRPAKRSGWASGQVDSDDASMGMEMSIGVLDERAVDRAIKPHERAFIRCFDRAGDARKYLSGQVVLRFVVSASGEVSDVQVVKNALGSYPVESCLVAQGKRIRFPPPGGRRGTDFEYSLSFRSTGEQTVLPWSGEEMARRLTGIASEMANCGSLGTVGVDVIAYVKPGGVVGSVGFACQGSLDPEAAVCVAALMRKVHVADAPTGHSSVVLRAIFPMALAFERASADSHRLSKRLKHRQ
jgi:TonB family protein